MHAGRVFDDFSIVDFPTGCVLAFPTGGHVERINVLGVTDMSPLLNSHHGHHQQFDKPTSPNSTSDSKNNGTIAINTQLSAESDVSVSDAAIGVQLTQRKLAATQQITFWVHVRHWKLPLYTLSSTLAT